MFYYIGYLDRLGNKIAIEKKLNIQASNGYFGQKKSLYNKYNPVLYDLNSIY